MKKNEETIMSFCKQCVWARIVYDKYVTLYEKGNRRLDLLEEVANHFFYDLQAILIEYILLQITKITDPAKTLGKHDNLTTNYLVNELPWPDNIRTQLEDLSASLNSFREYVVDARRKIIAHSDLKAFIDNDVLGSFPEGEEKLFWDNLKKFVDIIHDYYFGGPYPLEVVPKYDTPDLIEALKKSIDYDDYFNTKLSEKFSRNQQMRFKDA